VTMEVGGYSGWGVWLIVLVFAFNLACIPLWFLINHLRRTHEFRLKEVRTFLELLAAERTERSASDSQLDESIALIERQLEQAEGLGPLWGRKHVELARLGLYQVEHQHQDLCASVRAQMARPGSAGST